MRKTTTNRFSCVGCWAIFCRLAAVRFVPEDATFLKKRLKRCFIQHVHPSPVKMAQCDENATLQVSFWPFQFGDDVMAKIYVCPFLVLCADVWCACFNFISPVLVAFLSFQSLLNLHEHARALKRGKFKGQKGHFPNYQLSCRHRCRAGESFPCSFWYACSEHYSACR